MRRLILLVLIGLGVVSGAHAVAPKLYGRLALPVDGSRVLTVVLMWSDSAGARDALLADVDLNGKCEGATEKYQGTRRVHTYGETTYVTYAFPQLTVPAKGKQPACKVSITYQHRTAGGKALEAASASMQFSRVENGKTTQFQGVGPLVLSDGYDKVAKSGATGALALKVLAKPDGASGKTGLGVTCGWPGFSLRSGTGKVALTVKDLAGKSIHSHSAAISDLGFG